MAASPGGLVLPPHLRKHDPYLLPWVKLWRLVNEHEAPIQPDGTRRLSSSPFRTEEASVQIEGPTNIAQVFQDFPNWPLAVEITVDTVLKARCIVAVDPNDPKHGLIYDANNPGQCTTGGQANTMRRGMIRIIPRF